MEKKSRTVLDSLVRTILSQNTTDTLSARAFQVRMDNDNDDDDRGLRTLLTHVCFRLACSQSLKDSFPTYKTLLAAPVADVEVGR